MARDRCSKYSTIILRLHFIWRHSLILLEQSLLRSVPGIGLYYASLQVLQSNLSEQGHKPDNPLQAFCFGLAARSMISFALLPITVVKVRYESGLYKYSNLPSAVRDAYFKTGWIGGSPTILRDSLFSGIYYMCYTKLRLINRGRVESSINEEGCWNASNPLLNFTFGLISGLLASLITNPIDVLKTNMQVNRTGNISMKETVAIMLRDGRGYTRFFDGIFPRSLRRTLVAATTWTFYELFLDTLKKETC